MRRLPAPHALPGPATAVSRSATQTNLAQQPPHPPFTHPPTHPPFPSHDPLLELAIELEQAALADPWFQDRKLYPNVEFYSGIALRALGIPSSMLVGSTGAEPPSGRSRRPAAAVRIPQRAAA